ncbi:hypothetical protein PVAP13_1KG173677 [Panicum virgatum]|uniref:Uncharacterized protein n=1 Tax=Panicum virgatum TaxID=38727 RepID=A0A8T0XDK3_PANVG|nr:hypothetical protein PVAP13_1KG173677 [Panicum virgatum]
MLSPLLEEEDTAANKGQQNMRQILQMNQEQIDFHRLSYVQEESYQDQCRLDETASEGTEELQSIHMTRN